MKYYELTYLVPSETSESSLSELKEQIIRFLQETGGLLNEVKSISKNILGYPIKGKKAVFISTLNFCLDPEKLKDLEKIVRSENKILRYLIISSQKKEESPKISKRPELKEKKSVQKVELKEIEKKLDEILGE